MGWSKVEELPTVFAQQIQHAKKGDIIGPIRSSVGFHILKLNDIQRGNMPISVTEVKARHILIKLSPIMNNEQAHAKIQQIAQQIKTGQITFAEAAKNTHKILVLHYVVVNLVGICPIFTIRIS